MNFSRAALAQFDLLDDQVRSLGGKVLSQPRNQANRNAMPWFAGRPTATRHFVTSHASHGRSRVAHQPPVIVQVRNANFCS